MTERTAAFYARFGWPVGARLRFRLDAELPEAYKHLRGTRVRVLSPPIKVRIAGRPRHEVGVGQMVIDLSGENIVSPGLLEAVPGESILPQQEPGTAAPESHHRVH